MKIIIKKNKTDKKNTKHNKITTTKLQFKWKH